MRVKHFVISGLTAAIIGLTAVSASAATLPNEEFQIDVDYDNPEANAGNYDCSDFGLEEEIAEPEAEEGMIDENYENAEADAGNYDCSDFGLED